jgi:hypothetical protein
MAVHDLARQHVDEFGPFVLEPRMRRRIVLQRDQIERQGTGGFGTFLGHRRLDGRHAFAVSLAHSALPAASRNPTDSEGGVL